MGCRVGVAGPSGAALSGAGPSCSRLGLESAIDDLHDRRTHHDEEQHAEDDLANLATLLLFLSGPAVLADPLLVLVALETRLAGSGHCGEKRGLQICEQTRLPTGRDAT